MKKSSDGFLIGRVKSFRYAFKGAFFLITTEHSVITQSLLAVILIISGFLFHITKTEWLFQVLVIGLVLSIEGLNTAVEKLCDFIHSDYHKHIGFIKDIAAGAVTFAALTAVVVILIIYSPYIYEKVI
ncbi:diacylglycerol kinase (ATP) [Arcticibacter tournemirensis]|uniref:Diacylglycerol kinase family protein n=1 Tax=Arcticibacter tournemirensis TaxID=699437 RepID=A0A5M9GMX6_9SPHI|nr:MULTISPECIES: diacylglycerol kinase family protein [Bacteroidota]KAA8476022.1 diacylglycerol kinase family protein [Arcticibacter tournemirensis]TQM50097.1 diacylglycerol kinase (ATP) [Arcticibacter tournemirensis]